MEKEYMKQDIDKWIELSKSDNSNVKSLKEIIQIMEFELGGSISNFEYFSDRKEAECLFYGKIQSSALALCMLNTYFNNHHYLTKDSISHIFKDLKALGVSEEDIRYSVIKNIDICSKELADELTDIFGVDFN